MARLPVYPLVPEIKSETADMVVVSTSLAEISNVTLSPSVTIFVPPGENPEGGIGIGAGLGAQSFTTTRNSLRVDEIKISVPFDKVRYS